MPLKKVVEKMDNRKYFFNLRKKLTTEESGSAGPRSFSLLPKGMSIMDLNSASLEKLHI